MTATKLYDDVLMDHIKNARNYCALEKADREACGTNPLCGDEMTVYLRLAGDRVQQLAFQCTCCGVSMASASIMTESLSGMRTADALQAVRSFAEVLTGAQASAGGEFTHRAVVDAVKRFPSRLRCALLPWLTLEAALLGRREASFTP